jgi:catechol 2,3-dioxygenase-like lactoylglutathione lyase family enzyme
MIKTIRHVAIVVKKIKKSLQFYKKVLGFREFDHGSLSEIDALKLYGLPCEIVWYKLFIDENAMLELYYIKDVATRFMYLYENSPMGFSLNHFAVSVDDIKKYHKLLKKHGRLVSDIKEFSNHKLFFARDLDSNLIEFVEPPQTNLEKRNKLISKIK